MKSQKTYVFHSDVVGSMLRPRFLLEAQAKHKQGMAALAEVVAAEDRAVKDAVRIQERVGLDVITDGEMRRPVFCHNFVNAVDGFRWDIPGNTVIWFDMDGKKMVDPVTVGVVAKIKKMHDLSVDEFSFLRAIATRPTKVTIPSPTMMSYFFVPGISDSVYPSPNDFLDDVSRILKDAVSVLERIGVTYIQVDAPEFGMLLDPIQKEWFRKKGFNPHTLIIDGVERINEVLKNFTGTKGLHICRGNDKNRFMARGGYEAVANTVFTRTAVDRLLLEFDSDRAGDFKPLKHIPEDKTVVLGLVTTKSPVLEKDADIIAKIEEASQFVPIDRLAISTQCGFASVARGNNLTQVDQEKKLRLVTRIARQVWSI